MKYDVIIIGAGASGLYCAAHLKSQSILIIEKNQRIGLKVLASGSGQCNLTHGGYINAFYEHYGPRKSFVKYALSVHDNKAVIHYFEQQGLKCIERPDGKVFPESLRAADVVEVLVPRRKNTRVKRGESVQRCETSEDGFLVVTDKGEYTAAHMVIATGGRSYPGLGTTGDGYEFARALGHHVTVVKPGLTGVVTQTKAFVELQGIALENFTMTLQKKDKKRVQYKGAVLFTHFGLSGPIIINNSRDFDKGDLLFLNFIGETTEQAEKNFMEIANNYGDKPLAYYLNQIKLPDALKAVLMSKADFDRNTKLSVVTKVQRKWLMQHLTHYEIEIESLIGFNQAMVTVGGVSHEEVDPKTMASKIHPHLYFIGEVLDVDGDTGGYNLQWAFSSGYLAAQNIENHKKSASEK